MLREICEGESKEKSSRARGEVGTRRLDVGISNMDVVIEIVTRDDIPKRK